MLISQVNWSIILTMEIKILHLQEGAKKAIGTTVIIDVFRAFSLEAYLFYQGCKEILIVPEEKKAYEMKEKYPDHLLMGERHGKILPGFDYGNAPSLIHGIDFTNKTIIHTTSNGTAGIKNAIHADKIYVSSFVNAKATAQAILNDNPTHVSLVAMGWEGRKTEEDILCAEYIQSLLRKEPMKDILKLVDDLRYTEGKKFFDPSQQDVFPKNDFALCTNLDVFKFAIPIEVHDDYMIARKVGSYA